jgi:4-hydroxybenzoate polyprenyltransferase
MSNLAAPAPAPAASSDARTGGAAAGPVRLFASISRLHIVAIAALGTLTFGWLFTGAHPWLLAAICAVDWFVVNLLNRVVDIPEDEANGITGTGFVSRHRRALTVLGFGVLFASFAATHWLVPAITPLRAGYHALGLAYNWRLLPGRRRIKQLYFWKNTASALGFMLTVFGYPLAAAHAGGGLAPGVTLSTILVSALFFFTFELSYEVIYDLRDAEGDARSGVRTYPVVHGPRGAVRIIDALLLVSALTLAIGYATGAIPWRIAVMIAAPGLQTLLYKRALRRGITSGDCIAITWIGAALLATYHLWIAAGLPGVGD